MKRTYNQLSKCLILFATLFWCSTSIFAQGKLTGNVSDEDGPLIGATVKIVGKATGTTTDLDGNYSLELSPGAYVFLFNC